MLRLFLYRSLPNAWLADVLVCQLLGQPLSKVGAPGGSPTTTAQLSHCERSEAISWLEPVDCRGPSGLAMTPSIISWRTGRYSNRE